MAISSMDKLLQSMMSRLDSVERRQIPRQVPGEIVMHVVGNRVDAPPGTVWCDGSILLIDDYPRLFQQVGIFYGGDAITTFGVPNIANSGPIRYAIRY